MCHRRAAIVCERRQQWVGVNRVARLDSVTGRDDEIVRAENAASARALPADVIGCPAGGCVLSNDRASKIEHVLEAEGQHADAAEAIRHRIESDGRILDAEYAVEAQDAGGAVFR